MLLVESLKRPNSSQIKRGKKKNSFQFPVGWYPLWTCNSLLRAAQDHWRGRLHNILILFSETDSFPVTVSVPPLRKIQHDTKEKKTDNKRENMRRLQERMQHSLKSLFSRFWYVCKYNIDSCRFDLFGWKTEWVKFVLHIWPHPLKGAVSCSTWRPFWCLWFKFCCVFPLKSHFDHILISSKIVF